MPNQNSSRQSDQDKKLNRRNLIITMVVGVTVILTFLLELPTKISAAINVFKVTSTPAIVVNQQIQLKYTPVPRINKILEINFSYGDRGVCVTDDSKIGGNDTSQDNYFVFGKKNGYITYCNISPTVNQGNLEITADPHGSPDFFGYGVIMGFVGGENRNLCSFEVIRDFSKTKVVFGEYINGKFKPTSTQVEGYTLDTNSHTIRIVLYPDGKAVGFVDEIAIAEHTFAGCAEGRVGFVAYGQGDDKISFDDLKLYALP